MVRMGESVGYLKSTDYTDCTEMREICAICVICGLDTALPSA